MMQLSIELIQFHNENVLFSFRISHNTILYFMVSLFLFAKVDKTLHYNFTDEWSQWSLWALYWWRQLQPIAKYHSKLASNYSNVFPTFLFFQRLGRHQSHITAGRSGFSQSLLMELRWELNELIVRTKLTFIPIFRVKSSQWTNLHCSSKVLLTMEPDQTPSFGWAILLDQVQKDILSLIQRIMLEGTLKISGIYFNRISLDWNLFEITIQLFI